MKVNKVSFKNVEFIYRYKSKEAIYGFIIIRFNPYFGKQHAFKAIDHED